MHDLSVFKQNKFIYVYTEVSLLRYKCLLVILTCFMNTTLFGGEMNNQIQSYQHITSDAHPAASYVVEFLEAQKNKDVNAFAHCFGTAADNRIFVNLSGGVIMTDVQQLIKRHKELYASPVFHVEYGPLQNGMGNDDFFCCSVLVNVTLPDSSQRSNYIDMMFVREEGSEPEWIPVRLINTVVNSSPSRN